MAEKQTADQPQYVEIRLKGHLNDRWAGWFDGLKFVHQDDGTTIICGPVTDQAELYGLLRKVRDLGMALVSVNVLEGHYLS